jgi:hypothetical protein
MAPIDIMGTLPEIGDEEQEENFCANINTENYEVLATLFPEHYTGYSSVSGLIKKGERYTTPFVEGLQLGIDRFYNEKIYRPYIGSGEHIVSMLRTINLRISEEKQLLSEAYHDLNLFFTITGEINPMITEKDEEEDSDVNFTVFTYTFESIGGNETQIVIKSFRPATHEALMNSDLFAQERQFHETRFITQDPTISSMYNERYQPYLEFLKNREIIDDKTQLFLPKEQCEEILEKLELITSIKPKFLHLAGGQFKIGV